MFRYFFGFTFNPAVGQHPILQEIDWHGGKNKGVKGRGGTPDGTYKTQTDDFGVCFCDIGDFFGGGRGLPRLDSALPQSHVLSPWSVFLVIRDDQGQVKPGGNNSTMESCKLLLLFKD